MVEPEVSRSLPSRVYANQHIRSMSGQTQSKLVRASDREMYVCKFSNNPEGARALVNEVLGSRIATHLGLPTPPIAYVDFDPWLVENTPELTIRIDGGTEPCATGLQFGSRRIVGQDGRSCLDWLPQYFHRLSNQNAFAGAFVFDIWTGNTEGCQAIYRPLEGGWYEAIFVDYSQCFHGCKWDFPRDLENVGMPFRPIVLASSWDIFKQWLTKVDAITHMQMQEWTQDIPAEWYGRDFESLRCLMATLDSRRKELPRLVLDAKVSLQDLSRTQQMQVVPRIQTAQGRDLWREQFSAPPNA